MNYAGFKIVGVGSTDIGACAQFEYRGYIVSLSNIFTPPGLAVFDSNSEFVAINDGGYDLPQVQDVESAIRFIDGLVGGV